MRQELLAKMAVCVLIVIVCVIGIIYLIPLVEATEAAGGPSTAADGSSAAAPATLPLRWRVAYAAETASGPDDFCVTIVAVMNTTDKSVSVEVEWFSAPGTLLDTKPFTLSALQAKNAATDIQVDTGPFSADFNSSLDNFTGFAHVYANDPRIIVSAYLVCRDAIGATQNLTGMLPIPTFAVGESLEYFQAATPMMGGMPPVVVTRPPEER